MPGNRNRHPLVQLTDLPWWVSVVIAALVFAAIRWLGPSIAGTSPLLTPLAHALAANAHWFAAIFLLPIPFALLKTARRRKLVDGQASIDRIRDLSWQDFERLVAEAYRRQGYRVTERGGSGADGGIDIELRAKDKTLVVQCKRWKTRTAGVELVRELYGAMVGEHAHAAIFVTSGRYTPDAIDFARDKPIKLVDGDELASMLKDVQAKRTPQTTETNSQSTATSQPTDSRLPELPAARTSGRVVVSEPCPKCGSPMVRRTSRKGPNAGGAFWGCSRYPACRGTRET